MPLRISATDKMLLMFGLQCNKFVSVLNDIAELF